MLQLELVARMADADVDAENEGFAILSREGAEQQVFSQVQKVLEDDYLVSLDIRAGNFQDQDFILLRKSQII